MRHLQTGPLEAALDVEALVGLAAVEDGLVAADLLGDEVQRLDEAEAELLALLVLCDGDVLDVAYQAQVVDAGRDIMSARFSAGRVQSDGKTTYNFLSAISAPVPTTRPPSSMTST